MTDIQSIGFFAFMIIFSILFFIGLTGSSDKS